MNKSIDLHSSFHSDKLEKYNLEDFLEENRPIIEEFQCQICKLVYLKPFLLGKSKLK